MKSGSSPDIDTVAGLGFGAGDVAIRLEWKSAMKILKYRVQVQKFLDPIVSNSHPHASVLLLSYSVSFLFSLCLIPTSPFYAHLLSCVIRSILFQLTFSYYDKQFVFELQSMDIYVLNFHLRTKLWVWAIVHIREVVWDGRHQEKCPQSTIQRCPLCRGSIQAKIARSD